MDLEVENNFKRQKYHKHNSLTLIVFLTMLQDRLITVSSNTNILNAMELMTGNRTSIM